MGQYCYKIFYWRFCTEKDFYLFSDRPFFPSFIEETIFSTQRFLFPDK